MRILDWIGPPTTTNPADSLRAVVAHWVYVAGIGVVAILYLLLPFYEPDAFPYHMVYGTSLIAGFAGLAILHGGHPRIAGAVACSIAWLTVLIVSASSGGIESPALATMVLIVMLVGFLWSSRAGIVFAAITSLSILAMVVAGERGLLPDAGPAPTPLSLWSAMTAVLVVAAVFFHLALESIDESRRAAAQNAEQLEREMELREGAEESLRRAEKLEALGRLTGGIAHDFNNILTVLLAQSALLLEQAAESEVELSDDTRSQLAGIQLSAERAAVLTRRLLGFARPDAGSPEEVDPGSAVTRLEPVLRRVIPENIVLAIEPPPAGLRLLIDPMQLEQVLLNLVLNARDAMQEGGALGLAVTRTDLGPAQAARRAGASPGPHVSIAVSDSGAGIDPSDVERIFDPFFTTKDLGHGTGLGLSTVHGIVSRAGGHLEVRSVRGRGTTVIAHLPAHESLEGQTHRPARSAPGPAAVAASGGETILVCEDEAPVRGIIESVLRGAGYRVLSAALPDRALVEAREHSGRIDLLVTDVVMPRMSGPELAEQLRRELGWLPVLLVTGYAPEEVVPSRANDPATDLLEKPFTPAALLDRARALLAASPASGADARREGGAS
jgi:signal transduction histidine kinase